MQTGLKIFKGCVTTGAVLHEQGRQRFQLTLQRFLLRVVHPPHVLVGESYATGHGPPRCQCLRVYHQRTVVRVEDSDGVGR